MKPPLEQAMDMHKRIIERQKALIRDTITFASLCKMDIRMPERKAEI